MGPWRLEVIRLWRTRRLIALAATFLILGFGEPVLTYYLPDIINNANGNGVEISVPEQTAADSMAGFADNAGQLGTLIVVIVAAANLAIDANPGLAAFYRTRIHEPSKLVLPRYAVVTVATVATLILGTLAAWYETVILFSSVPVDRLLGGLAFEALWFCLVTSIVTFFASVIRGVLGVVGASIGLLLGLALLGNLPSISDWLPTSLSGSSADLIQHAGGDLWKSAIVASVVAVAALGLAVHRFGMRQF
jgi:ABC-2 type transport system permease protein